MEDILNSIRRIMADDHKSQPVEVPEPARASDEPVSVNSIESDILALRNALNAVRNEMEDVKDDLIVSDQSGLDVENSREEAVELKPLVSLPVEEVIRQSFSDLTRAASKSREMDVEAVAEKLLRPMLQQWLDAHLPGLVERLVREEVSRLSGRQD